MAVFLDGSQLDRCDPAGHPVVDDSLLLLFNTDASDIDFVLADIGPAAAWDVLVDTAGPDEPPASRTHGPRARISVPARTVVILQAVTEPIRDRGQHTPRQGQDR